MGDEAIHTLVTSKQLHIIVGRPYIMYENECMYEVHYFEISHGGVVGLSLSSQSFTTKFMVFHFWPLSAFKFITVAAVSL